MIKASICCQKEMKELGRNEGTGRQNLKELDR